jgi:hypothetical protein
MRPHNIVSYPLLERAEANVGSSEDKTELFEYIPMREGIFPVMKDILDGAHNGNGQYAFSNRTPREASLSRFGVETTGSP